MKTTEKNLKIGNVNLVSELFGNFDENINLIEKQFGVIITSHLDSVKIKGEEENLEKALQTVEGLLSLIEKGEKITAQNINYLMGLIEDGKSESIESLKDLECIMVTSRGKPVKPKTIGQQRYVDAIKKNTITVGVGPAGTGKTYLAVAMAVTAYRSKQINRIVLTRPAVEAGESLGFLPGDLQQKVDPYLRPLYDALFDMLGAETFARCQERGDIEVAPLAYMRGRTLDDSFIILDEAQNTTNEQMKMFLTRLGNNSKIVVTGDITQIDLPSGKKSGLKTVINILKNIEDIAIIRLSGRDVVRHKLVQEIIKAYEKNEERIKKYEQN
ncbi:MAG: PhoH family protein [Clostridiales bacterium]|nr:PhoH family protein [Candidatus Equinaster intestinalis]